ncbi:hypothetical protein C1S70_30285 (plasmid) [Azospirillum argentinense]|uniref:Class I SAM-dependent methyltransferase n=1 Tax=Azospirillum argentinense TaxID=2970906 RepID=A0A2K1FRL0_9PROT|nr:hypothetical protein C1S70_30285 [Azospirillum argentinense]
MPNWCASAIWLAYAFKKQDNGSCYRQGRGGGGTVNASYYEGYGLLANRISSPLLLSGRNLFHAPQIAAIIEDIAAKLALRPSDRLLDIGCNVGLLLRPLASRVARSVGVDHAEVLKQFDHEGTASLIELVAGQWPDVEVEGGFNCILAYSVVQCLQDKAAIDRFVASCLGRLLPGGRLLIGDIPNTSTWERFVQSTSGQAAVHKHELSREKERADTLEFQAREAVFRDNANLLHMTDADLLDLTARLRAQGFNTYVLPQPPGLPHYGSREDLLVVRPD